jgi:hypothetical protein
MFVRGAIIAGGTAGAVELKNSAGTVVAVAPFTFSVASWLSVTGVLPASSAKCDPHLRRTSGTGSVNVSAVSRYEHIR